MSQPSKKIDRFGLPCFKCENKVDHHMLGRQNCRACIKKYVKSRPNKGYRGQPCIVCVEPVDHDWYSHRRCRKCNTAFAKIYYQPERQRNNAARQKFGVDLPKMLEETPNCGICHVSLTSGDKKPTRFAIDHCHTTGVIRGLLCNKCNRGIGLLKDSIPILQSAIQWLSASRDTTKRIEIA